MHSRPNLSLGLECMTNHKMTIFPVYVNNFQILWFLPPGKKIFQFPPEFPCLWEPCVRNLQERSPLNSIYVFFYHSNCNRPDCVSPDPSIHTLNTNVRLHSIMTQSEIKRCILIRPFTFTFSLSKTLVMNLIFLIEKNPGLFRTLSPVTFSGRVKVQYNFIFILCRKRYFHQPINQKGTEKYNMSANDSVKLL